MKRRINRALSLLLTLAMCLSLLPVNVLAEPVTTVTIDASSATLTGGDRPTATLSWSLSPALSSTEGIMTEVYAWAGSSTTRPDKCWFMTVGGNQTDTQTTTGGSFNGYLAADNGAEKLSGACMMQVELVDGENNPIATSTTVAVTVAAPTPPTVQEVAFYHQYVPIGSGDDGTGAWYHFKGGSSNLEAFALSQADSEESAYNSSYQMSGFKVDDQWYKVEALYTVGSHDHDLMVKDNGEMVVNAVPLSFAIAPEEGDKLWLALWDYNASALSNVVEITVPAVNSTTGEIAATLTPTLSIGTASLPDATVGQAYTATLSGSAANGGALSWSVSSGALPAGLTLSGGTISGTPTTVGSSTFELTLSEAGGGSVKKQFALTVSSPKPRINVSMPADPLVKGRAYTIPLKGAASGGGTLSWSVKDGGSLPTGMSLAPSTGADAAISGTPTATGTFRFTLTLTETATDTTTTAAEQQCTLTVREPASYNITFLTNGGSSVESTTVAESTDGTTTFTLPAAPTKRGSNFGGWHSSADYKTYPAGETVTVSRDTRFSAQWTDKDAVTATYNGEVVGNVYLYGKLEGDREVWLDSSWSSEVRNNVALTVSPWQLSGYALTGLSLKAYVDGSYTEIASYNGDPDGLDNGASVTLTAVRTVRLAKGAVASNEGLTAGVDYRKPDSAYNAGLGWSLSFPFLTSGTGYEARFYDRYTDRSKGYIWDKKYGLTLDEDGIFRATIAPFEPDATLTGRIKDGANQGVQGAVVSVSQYVHGQSWSDTAVTGADGAYSLRCFHGDGVAARVSVVSDGMTAYNESGVAISDASVSKDITLNKVTAAVRVDPDTANMSDAARNELLSRYEYRPTVRFYDKAATDPTRKLLASAAVAFGQTAYVTVPNQVESATLYWTVSGDYVQSESGSVTFADSKATVTQIVQPTPAVMLTLTAPSYGNYALAWFDGSGAAKGRQSFYLYQNSSRTLLLPFPGVAGTYTLALTPDYCTAGSLAAIPGDMLLKKWEGLTRQAGIQVLDSFTLTAAQTENAAYVTKPNSTLTAGADSFSSASELVRFTGTVGLDDGLTGGKLTQLHYDPRNPVQSYSNSATLVCAVVGGKVYQSGWTVNAVSEYTLDLGDGVDLPCDYTLYCRPGSIDWDMMLKLSADVTCNNRSYSEQLVGSATVAKPGASISTASLTVCSDEISVKGVAKPNEAVAIYDSGTPVGTAKADYRGAWSARVPLYGTQAGQRTRHGVYAVTDSGTVSNELLILHNANAPELTSFRMAWEKYDYTQEIEMGDSYTFVGQMKDVTFKAAFKNPGALAAMESWDNAKVVFEYELTSGETGTVKATGPDADGVFTATIPGYLTSSVTGARPIFRAAAPDDAAQYLETAANGGTVLMSQASKAALDALAGTVGENSANLAGTIRNELAGATAEDSYTVTFENDTASLTGTQLGETATPASDENGNTRIPAKAEAQQNMQASYDSLAAAGVKMHSVSETYGDETTTVAWLQREGGVWTGLLPNATAEANKLPVFTAQFDLQTIDPVRYERERTLLAQYADIHNSMYDVGSVATANAVVDSYFFTDAEPDENGELGCGTYLASVRVLGDKRNDGAYLVEAVLWMTGEFTGFKGALKDPVPVTAALVRNDPDSQNIVPGVTVKTSAGDGVSSVEGGSGDGALYLTLGQIAYDYTVVGRASNNALGAAKYMVDNGTNAGNLVSYRIKEQLVNEKLYTSNAIGKGAAFLSLVNLVTSSINFFSSDGWEKQYNHVKSLMDSKTGERMKRLDPIGYQGLQDSLDAVRSFGRNSNEWAWGSYLTGNAGNAAGSTGLFSSFISTCSGALIGVGSYVFGSIFSDQAATQASLRDVMYKDCLERFSEWLIKDALTNHDPDAIAMYKQFTGKSRAIPLNDGSNRQYTQSTVYNKVSNDPSGIVFEGVIENPVENANVTLWYAVNAGGGLEKTASGVSSIVPADGVDGMIPASAEQVTGADGRYQWFVPEGLWYVTAESGTRKGSSDNDTAANQSVTVSTGPKGNTNQTYNLLPVLPVQLDVNIPLVDTAAPVVTAVQYTTDGVFVTFSKYMDESTLISANFRIAVDGGEAKNAANVEFVERGSTPANLGEVKHYTRAVKLTPADSIQAGSNITLTVMSGVKSYADTPFGADYVSGGVIVAPEKLGMPTWAVDGVAKTGATITVTNGSGLTIRLPDGAPAGAKVLYSADGGSTWKEYSGVIVLNKNMVIRAKATAVGYTDSDVISASFTIKSGANIPDNSNNGRTGGGAATSGDKTGVGSIETTAKVSGGKAQASVSASSAAAALKNAKAGDTLTVKVDTGKADDVSVTLPAKTVQTVADAKADVRLETGRGTVTLDADTVAELAKVGADAAVSVTKNADGTTTVAVTSGGKNVDARLKVALPAAAGGETLMLVNADGSTTPVKKSIVENGVVYAEIPAGATVKVASAAKSFPDVPADAWYAKSVKFVTSHGLFQGTDTGFEPDATMTRAMLATVLYRLEDGRSVGKNRFTDVPDGQWFTDAVIWADSAGIVNGTAGMQFSPDEPVTREQIATMLYRYAKAIGLDTTGRAELNGFSDGGKTASWASEAMQWAVSAGLFKGDANGALNPGGKATRAEVATLLERMVSLIVK